MNTNTKDILLEQFGDYRAEWRRDLFASLFIAPPYFAQLESTRPCFLVGGRGTGKTVALQSLRFDATRTRLHGSTGLPYLGIYLRINKNRVRAFPEGPDAQAHAGKVFAHYFNLLACAEFTKLCEWLVREEHWAPFTSDSICRIATALCIARSENLVDLRRHISDALIALELHVNNPDTVGRPNLSMAETPLRLFVEEFQEKAELKDRLIFCCIDEYENLLDYQQAVVNTYVKHSEPPLSYKIGVRRHGLRCRHTSDATDLLNAPDDYEHIDISKETADTFAVNVVERRLLRARSLGANVGLSMHEFLPGLSRREEAKLLGAEDVSKRVYDTLAVAAPDLAEWARSEIGDDAYFMAYWSQGRSEGLSELAEDWRRRPTEWRTRLTNYGYESLFSLSRGRKGARIRKYYCGAETFLSLASGNIRYLLQLVDESLQSHFATHESAARPVSVAPREQTLAARAVGKLRLEQLEGLSERGFELKRLVLAIGKVFFEFARSPIPHTPEVTSFILSGSGEALVKITELLHEGVSHLAFEVEPRTKATTDSEMKDDEYRLHPIYAAFFEYSHRKKRRVTFAAEALLEVGRNPSGAISQLLAGRKQSEPQELPDQLAMFSSFYLKAQADVE